MGALNDPVICYEFDNEATCNAYKECFWVGGRINSCE